MKRIRKIIILIISILCICVNTVHADVGPKPSVNITFNNAPDNLYFVTLLSNTKVMGPWHQMEKEELNQLVSPELDAFEAFMELDEKDDYYFLNYVLECSSDDKFSWTYYPPNTFKIAIYDVKTKNILLSESIDKKSFNSFYDVDLKDGKLEVKERKEIGNIIIDFIVRLLLTLLIETLLGYIFGFKKYIKTILATNTITYICLNIILSVFAYILGGFAWLIFYVLSELIVLIVETFVYLIKFKDENRFKIIIYTLFANVLTFFLGLYVGIYFLTGYE